MILPDTTILVYALGDDDRLRAPSRDLLEMARDGVVRASTTIEVIQEFPHVRSRRRPRAEAAERAKEYALGLGPLARHNEDDLHRGLDLFQASGDLGPFDAVLAATAIGREWALASADRAFAQVDALAYLDPALPALLDDVRAAG